MRIFTAVRHSSDPRFYYGGLWSGNFYPALRELGHEVVESQVDLLPTSRFMDVKGGFTSEEKQVRAHTTESIVREVALAHKAKPLDLFLSYFYNAHFDPDGFDELRRLGIPSVNFYCNSIYQFDFVAEIAAKADFSWHAERDAGPLYLHIKANPVWVQMAADPNVYRPVPSAAREVAACFVGQRYADRDRWMAALVEAAVPLAIYGPGWSESRPVASANGVRHPGAEYLGRKSTPPQSLRSYLGQVGENVTSSGAFGGLVRSWRQYRYRQHSKDLLPLFAPLARGAIPFQRIFEVFSSHEVILNFSNVWADGRPGSALIPHVRLRDFEAPMCRTCYITGYTDEITEFYEPDNQIVTYRSSDELVDKTRYYLAHPNEAERVRAAGYERARRDHTWTQRFKELFSKIGLSR
jgi:spore maturation protein CgeB